MVHFTFQQLKDDWLNDAKLGFEDASSLLKHDVQAPDNLEELRNSMENVESS